MGGGDGKAGPVLLELLHEGLVLALEREQVGVREVHGENGEVAGRRFGEREEGQRGEVLEEALGRLVSRLLHGGRGGGGRKEAEGGRREGAWLRSEA